MKRFVSQCRWTVSALLLLLFTTVGAQLCVIAAPQPASAQTPVLQLLGATSGNEEEAPARPQSRPSQSFRSSDGPTVQDYARLNEQQRDARPMTASLDAAGDYLGVFRARLVATLARVPDALVELDVTMSAASPTGRAIHFLGIAVFAGLLLLVGSAVAELYLAFVARPIFVRMQRDRPRGYSEKLPVLVARVVLVAFSVTITLSVATATGLFFYDEHPETLLTVIIVFATYAAVLLVHAVLRISLAPFLPQYRIPFIEAGPARALYRWVSVASVIAIAGAAFAYWVEGIGLPREILVIVTAAVTLVTLLVLLATIRANHRGITSILIGDRQGRPMTWVQRAVAAAWAPAAGLYLIVSWADLVFRLVMGADAGPERLMVPFFVVVVGAIVYAVVIYAVERVFDRQRRLREVNARAAARAEAAVAEAREREAIASEAWNSDGADIDDDGDEEGGGRRSAPGAPADAMQAEGDLSPVSPPGAGMRNFEDLARRVASLLALGVGAWLFVWYWGGREMFAESAAFGVAEDVIDILFVGYIAFHAARIWLDQKIRDEGGDEDMAGAVLDGEGGGAGATRVATLLPLIRNFILTIIGITVLLLTAIEMGVNVAPLFAGAGVVGLAIGFGAQTLVRDIISGAFFLLDDAFRKGEYIDVGSVKGTVEKISLRSFQLRHHLGMLHTIPFGEVQFLTNFSRDWVMMKLPLRLTYDTDVERVRKLVKKLGQSLMEDETVGHLFLQPLKSQGVIQMEDSAMIVRVKFMTRPGDQWVVRKRVYADIRELFDREGIKFAHREVTVRIPDLDGKKAGDLTEGDRQAIGAATRANLDVIEAEQMRPTGTGGPVDDR
ncbi:MAG: mechanosensitive ion channel family protein [Pseudomonadota bacterium]